MQKACSPLQLSDSEQASAVQVKRRDDPEVAGRVKPFSSRKPALTTPVRRSAPQAAASQA